MVYLNIKSHVIKETEIFIPVVRGNYNNFHQGISQLDFFFSFLFQAMMINITTNWSLLRLGVLLPAFVLEGVLTPKSLCAEFQWKILGMSPCTHSQASFYCLLECFHPMVWEVRLPSWSDRLMAVTQRVDSEPQATVPFPPAKTKLQPL